MARIILGCGFLIFGVVGLFLPILQGVLFLTLGVVFLAPYVPCFRRLKLTLYWRFPPLRWKVDRLRRRVHSWLESGSRAAPSSESE